MWLKRTLLFLGLAATLYALLNYHFIFYGGTVKALKKSRMTMDYTFFNAQGKKVKSILAIDDLRRGGIGKALVDWGIIAEEDMLKLTDEYDSRGK